MRIVLEQAGFWVVQAGFNFLAVEVCQEMAVQADNVGKAAGLDNRGIDRTFVVNDLIEPVRVERFAGGSSQAQ